MEELAVITKKFELPAEISNFEELKQAFTPKLDFYKSLVVTEDSIINAKDDRSKLNKMKKAIDKRRIEIKKEYLAPYQVIENEFKQLITLIDEPINAIDEQLKPFDEKDLQDKRDVLEEHFRTENTLDFVKFEDVLPEKWENKTEKAESLKAEISTKLSTIKSDFAYLENMYSRSPLWAAIFIKYVETKDKATALSYAVELERTERLLNAPVSHSVSGNVITLPERQTAITDDFRGSHAVSGAFRATCTVGQLENLCNFMLQHDIKFEVIKEENSNGKKSDCTAE